MRHTHQFAWLTIAFFAACGGKSIIDDSLGAGGNDGAGNTSSNATGSMTMSSSGSGSTSNGGLSS